MRGLLHRLASRASGTAVLVRTDARLPFSGWAFERGPGRGGARGIEASIGDEPRQSTSGRWDEPHAPADLQGASVQARGVVGDPRAAPMRRAEGSAVDPINRDRGITEVSGSKPGASTVSLETGDASDHSPRQQSPEPMLAARATLEPKPSNIDRQRSPTPEASVGLRRDPSPLLSPQPPEHLTRVTANKSIPAGLPGGVPPLGATEDADEIHVHIGRIEVSAVY